VTKNATLRDREKTGRMHDGEKDAPLPQELCPAEKTVRDDGTEALAIFSSGK